MSENRVNAKVAPTDKAAVMTEIASIRSKLPASIDLSAEERQSLPKLGPKSERFVRAAASMVATAGSFLPASCFLWPHSACHVVALRRRALAVCHTERSFDFPRSCGVRSG